MIKDFKTKNSDGRLIVGKRLLGLGFNINFTNASFHREILFCICIDLIFIRFWFNFYKK